MHRLGVSKFCRRLAKFRVSSLLPDLDSKWDIERTLMVSRRSWEEFCGLQACYCFSILSIISFMTRAPVERLTIKFRK